jgi:hypothetical protein
MMFCMKDIGSRCWLAGAYSLFSGWENYISLPLSRAAMTQQSHIMTGLGMSLDRMHEACDPSPPLHRGDTILSSHF